MHARGLDAYAPRFYNMREVTGVDFDVQASIYLRISCMRHAATLNSRSWTPLHSCALGRRIVLAAVLFCLRFLCTPMPVLCSVSIVQNELRAKQALSCEKMIETF